MITKIFIDLCHNENYKRIPGGIVDFEVIFEFSNPADPFPRYRELKRYDLLIMGEILPAKNGHDHLFQKDEIREITRYVDEGGKILITTSSGGDFDYTRNRGSLRALSQITGVERYWWGELFCKTQGRYLNNHENLIFSEFPPHAIFEDVNKIVLADCTFFDLDEEIDAECLLYSSHESYFNYYSDDYDQKIGQEPIIVANNYGDGKTLIIGATLFMTDHKEFGLNTADNKIFIKNIIDWLLL